MARSIVLHASDLHLDAPFSGVGRTPEHVATALRDAALDAWDALVDLAIERRAAALLLAGGLCGGLERGARAQVRLRDGLGRLSAAGVRVCIALGDTDPHDGFAAIPAWPSGVTVFRIGEPSAVPLDDGGRRIATVHGVSAARGGHGAELPRATGAAAAGPHLALLHAGLTDHTAAAGGCAVCSPVELRAQGMDYWALGHAHAFERVRSGAPWIVYPGTPQSRGLDPSECGAKGVVQIEIEDGAIARVQFEPIDRVRCLRVALPYAPDLAALAQALTVRAEALRARHAGRGLVLQAVGDGGSGAARALGAPDARAELLTALRGAATGWAPFVWWARVQTTAADARPGGDLVGEVGRCRAGLRADAVRRARFFARFEPLRDAWAADVDPGDADELLDAAAALAVAALHTDRG